VHLHRSAVQHGHENWVYNDNVNSPEIRKWLRHAVGKEGEDLSRHDKWLCMMYPRVALLKEFLSEDGAIFIVVVYSVRMRKRREINWPALCVEECGGKKNSLSLRGAA
jgi:hypothetical protein